MSRETRFKNHLAILAISILLQACSGLQDDREYRKGEDVTGDSTPDNSTTTQNNELRNALVQSLRDGEYVEINFNRAGHVDDVDWLNQGDPMGPLQAGRKYVLSFDEETGEFTTVGWHEAREQNWVAKDDNANLNAFEVSLWGREFLLIQEQSVVLIRDSAFDVVGEARIITTPSIDGVRSRLMSGDDLWMNFNQLDPELDTTQTGSNVPGWSGSFATDPLGTFLIGEEYLLNFYSDEDAFDVIGLQESTGTTFGATTSRTLLDGHEAQLLEKG